MAEYIKPALPEPAREAEGAGASWRNASPDYYTADQMQACADACVAAALAHVRAEPEGNVVVTKTQDGRIVAVTRQDEEGRILSVIAEADPAHVRTEQGEPVALPEGYEPHELPADYTGKLWIEGQVRALARTSPVHRSYIGWTDADADAARLALELECLLTDKDVPMPALSRWWDSAHEALELHRKRMAEPQPVSGAADPVGLPAGETTGPVSAAPTLTLSDEQQTAIQQWLDFGEQMRRDGHQRGYYSGIGWAAVQLRSILAAAQPK